MSGLTKRCSLCLKIKQKTEFSKDSSRLDGFQYRCKTCDSKKTKKSFEDRKEQVLERCRKHYYENKDKYVAKSAKRRAAKLQAMLKYGKEHLKKDIDIWYRRAKLATLFMGEKYHVDHIEPLQGVDVCGLHVPWNLQLLTAKENISKGNRRHKVNARKK